MPTPVVQVDAFTDTPYAGNPAAVCVLPSFPDEDRMLAIAREMNLSETAFVVRREGASFDLRWFTPTVEVDLCGHATLASAHLLWEDGACAPQETIAFATRSGELCAVRDGEWIELDFPAREAVPSAVPREVIDLAGVVPAVTARGIVGAERSGYLLELATEQEVRDARPDIGALRAIPDGYLTLTAPASTPGYDFVSRFFAPAAGVDEDPVTGSAHCTLGPWWQAKLGADEMLAYQASARGGTIRVRPRGDRVRLGGRAVTVLRGELLH